MAHYPVNIPWELTMSRADEQMLRRHLFQHDGAEHGAIVLAGMHILKSKVRLLVKDVVLAQEGVDHVIGPRGFQMLTSQFVHKNITRAREEKLIYLSIHNHGGTDSVSFSTPDFASHERGYPALLDLANGLPVGALVFARNAVAGDIWLPGGSRVELNCAKIIGANRKILRPRPAPYAVERNSTMYSRQVLLFGEAGQSILRHAKVGIIGLGGIGSQLAELLARLGVGQFVLIDGDRADISNLPRLLGSRRSDVLVSESSAARFNWMKPALDKLRRRKVDMASRNIWRANKYAEVEAIFAKLEAPGVAEKLLDCDFVFLAADTMTARLIFNAVVQQYLIPGVQVGAKVVADENTGKISDVYAVSRPIFPRHGCLFCNSLINITKLQLEATSDKQARVQRYGTESAAPSVITLNALAAADAVNVFQFYITGLATEDAMQGYVRMRPLSRSVTTDLPRSHSGCVECSYTASSRFGRGDGRRLPTR